MIFLVLILSCISFAATEVEQHTWEGLGDEPIWEDDDRMFLYRNCHAGLMNTNIYNTLGIPHKSYKLSDYNISDHRFDDIKRFLLGSPELTFRKKFDLAKYKHTELSNEIDHFIAVTFKETYVYMETVRHSALDKKVCIITDKCEAILSQTEDIYLLEYYLDIVHHLFLKFGSETVDTWKKTTELFDESKVLNLTCDSKCVHQKYNEWLNYCTELNQQSKTDGAE